MIAKQILKISQIMFAAAIATQMAVPAHAVIVQADGLGVVGVGKQEVVNAWNACRIVKNAGASPVMVPVETAAEWYAGTASFLTNIHGMPGVSAAACGNPGGSDARYVKLTTNVIASETYYGPSTFLDYGVGPNTEAELRSAMYSGTLPSCGGGASVRTYLDTIGTGDNKYTQLKAGYYLNGNLIRETAISDPTGAVPGFLSWVMQYAKKPAGYPFCGVNFTVHTNEYHDTGGSGSNSYELIYTYRYRVWPEE